MLAILASLVIGGDTVAKIETPSKVYASVWSNKGRLYYVCDNRLISWPNSRLRSPRSRLRFQLTLQFLT